MCPCLVVSSVTESGKPSSFLILISFVVVAIDQWWGARLSEFSSDVDGISNCELNYQCQRALSIQQQACHTNP